MKELLEAVLKLEQEKGWTATRTEKLVGWIQDELDVLKNAKSKAVRAHQLNDILVLLLQISLREGIDLEKEFKKGLQSRKKRY